MVSGREALSRSGDAKPRQGKEGEGREGRRAGGGREQCGTRKEKKSETARGRERCHCRISLSFFFPAGAGQRSG